MKALTIYKVIIIISKTLYKYSIFFVLYSLLTMESAHIGLELFMTLNIIGMVLSLLSSLPLSYKNIDDDDRGDIR
jgi:hypothetical protein